MSVPRILVGGNPQVNDVEGADLRFLVTIRKTFSQESGVIPLGACAAQLRSSWLKRFLGTLGSSETY